MKNSEIDWEYLELLKRRKEVRKLRELIEFVYERTKDRYVKEYIRKMMREMGYWE